MKKVYLGDAVYADYDGYQIRLTVEYGTGEATAEIYLEPAVYAALVRYAEGLKHDDA